VDASEQHALIRRARQALPAAEEGIAVKAAAATLLALALLAAGCSGGTKAGGRGAKRVIVLTMATQIPGAQPDQLVRFANEVAKRSGGTIRIDFKANWRAGDLHQEIDTIRDVKAARVDLAWVGARAWDWVGVKSFDPLVAPLLIDSYPLEQEVFLRGIPHRMLPGVQRAGVVGIGVLPGPLRKVLGVHRRLVRPSDFRGVRFGVQGIIAADSLQALGARPQQLFAEAPLGSLGGLESQMSAIVGQYDTTARFLSANLSLWPRPLVIFAGEKIFRKLSPRQRAALGEAATAAIPDAMAASEQEDAGAVRSLCAPGKLALVDLTLAQLDSLRQAVAPVYGRLERDPASRAAIGEIDALKRGLPPPPAFHCSRTPSSAATSGTSKLDGVYEVNTTRAELAAAGGVAEGDMIPENWGHFVYVFDRGRLALTQEDAQACTWQYAKVGVSRKSTTWTFIDGGATKSPNKAYNKPGDKFGFKWSLYRNMLTLSPLPGAISPVPYRVKPLERISATPSRSYLSKDCPPPKAALP
jgi:TRAP-type C4-dicarboxylate transport system substrate-binding protein